MDDQLYKLRPDRDLQCYFFQPSAIAALSETSESGFTISGNWRQQFDWAVLEWNRDNVFEHPALRNLPDGDLSGLHLSYQETRTNCIPVDSTWYPTVDWPYLRVWAESGWQDTVYEVPIAGYAAPVVNNYASATAVFELQGTPTSNDYVELAWLDKHFNHQIQPGDTLEMAVSALASAINSAQSPGVTALAAGTQIALTCTLANGSNGNRIGVYGTVSGSGTESWTPTSCLFGGGVSPSTWLIDLDFSKLQDRYGNPVPMTNVRKMRWTWAADVQTGSFVRSEFSVVVTNWKVSGTNLKYQVSGPGSFRIDDNDTSLVYQGAWTEDRGNYFAGSSRFTATNGSQLACTYFAQGSHLLYLGTRRAAGCGQISVQVDQQAAVGLNLQLPEEDELVRILLGSFDGPEQHSVSITYIGTTDTSIGTTDTSFYFDFFEIAVPSASLPVFDNSRILTLATDWDTNHCLALAPERTAWLINTLGFQGRANHYAGALWFYELCQAGQSYATVTVSFSGTPVWSDYTTISLDKTLIQHQNLKGDTAETIATCFALLINAGSSGVWAQSGGADLIITSRTMGSAGNGLSIAVTTDGSQFLATTSGPALAGGTDGPAEGPEAVIWRTDLQAQPRINRAARDWTASYLRALKSYGIDVSVSFSMELQHGEDSMTTGLAQRYPDGTAVWLNTPSLQTNFSPVSAAFWRQVHSDMAGLMAGSGCVPYLQFGEVQWWYFASQSGMPFYDAYTTASFQALYDRPMGIISSQNASPNDFPQECAFLPTLIGQFTNSIASFVRQNWPATRFEVLYPPDVNDTPLNKLVNLPAADWTPAKLNCLKTENFTYTGDRNLDKALASIELPLTLGFGNQQTSHLVGIGDYTTPWEKEQNLSVGQGLESVVLFALDQFCLLGYNLPLENGTARATFLGG